MTTLNFDISAVFPGYSSRQPWDFDWTAPVLSTQFVRVIIAETNGVGTALSVTDSGNGTSAAEVPLFYTPGEHALEVIFIGPLGQQLVVDTNSYLVSDGVGHPHTEQSVALQSPWNSVKDIRVSDISSQVFDVSGFVDTWVDAAADNSNHVVNIDSAKRGLVSLGDGNDTVRVGVAANEYTWSSHFNIALGNGNDTVDVRPEASSVVATLVSPSGGVFNATPQLTTADITVGDGNDTVSVAEISGTIHVGGGTDTINIVDGNSEAWLGHGSDVVMIGAPVGGDTPPYAYDTQTGSSIIHAGSGHADITIDDTIPARTPLTTLEFIHGETGGGTLATADAVRYGHYDFSTASFLGGDLGAVTIDLAGYSAGSTVTLAPPTSAGGGMLLQIHDAVTGGVDALALYGATVTSVAALHVRFV